MIVLFSQNFVIRSKIGRTVCTLAVCTQWGFSISHGTGSSSIDQWRIQDFPEKGVPTLEVVCQPIVLQNCMKMKEFGPMGRVPSVP